MVEEFARCARREGFSKTKRGDTGGEAPSAPLLPAKSPRRQLNTRPTTVRVLTGTIAIAATSRLLSLAPEQ